MKTHCEQPAPAPPTKIAPPIVCALFPWNLQRVKLADAPAGVCGGVVVVVCVWCGVVWGAKGRASDPRRHNTGASHRRVQACRHAGSGGCRPSPHLNMRRWRRRGPPCCW